MPPVSVRRETLVLPTYVPQAPDRNPMFLETRVYQGSSGRVYPLPFCDRIAGEPVSQPWETVVLENEFLAVTILPALGGRIHRVVDKTNNYDVIYYQPVIKPALVGLAGPWISGGIEFNWPQHHRPSTFMPADVHIESHADGAVTVWLSEQRLQPHRRYADVPLVGQRRDARPRAIPVLLPARRDLRRRPRQARDEHIPALLRALLRRRLRRPRAPRRACR
jgi:hypothetical protein